ncbi:capsule assembly Wzi family protein, partial [Oleiphilus sp. HI0061]|uniref:capsule assembly Wzi family protein n=1 Tax=Oleiphilus sp. HI0061 TaxID=1822239 RepID=UPI000AE51D04
MIAIATFIKYELEYANTIADGFETVFYNTTYEHSLYESGYRYHGRTLGASFDNDSEVLSFGMSLQNGGGSLWSARASYLQLNEDGGVRGNGVALSAQSLYMAELYHQCFIFDGRFKAGLTYLSKDVDTAFTYVERLAASVSWEYR